ncbi:S41 family peptidase [Oerskovia flava]|uniref:S41 family peptidase n=1 Tax=Oerskovia flava TaxID=2986422 RepID=UPI00224004BD|nr:S41 family peptidase [Oerskovia sp. JB1-3-2]
MTRQDVRAAREGEPLGVDAWRTTHLDGGERLQVVDTVATVLAGVYTHLPAKRAAYASDPVQALVLLRRRAVELSDAEFHLAVTGILAGLRDAHTRYLGPAALRGHVAVLPFLVEEYGPPHDLHHLVSTVNAEATSAPVDPGFAAGVEVLEWNGVPIARAVQVHADRESGGRADSRRARALESLTFRALDYGPPPDEHWVIVGYRTEDGSFAEARFDWRVVEPGRAGTAVRAASRGALKVAVDPAAEAVRRAKKLQFVPGLWASDDAPAAPARPADPVPVAGEWIETPMQDVVAARALDDEIGHLRLWSFDLDDDDAYLDEVTRLLGLLPTGGLVVDLRGNPGGLVWAAERALQLFTDRPVVPTRFSLAATPLTRQMAASPFNRMELEAWHDSLQDAVSTGELYAQPLPLTDPAWCNDRGRAYPGPAVAVVDANTYSSGDLFAAGWVDNDIGPLVAVGAATGGGGANVWTLTQLRDALVGTDVTLGPLPAGAGMTVAIRRAVRSGRGDGIPIEDLGVPGQPYTMTRDDLLHANRDLLATCRSLLVGGPPSDTGEAP